MSEAEPIGMAFVMEEDVGATQPTNVSAVGAASPRASVARRKRSSKGRAGTAAGGVMDAAVMRRASSGSSRPSSFLI